MSLLVATKQMRSLGKSPGLASFDRAAKQMKGVSDHRRKTYEFGTADFRNGTFRTWRDVRLESVVRTKADSAAGYRFALARSAANGGD